MTPADPTSPVVAETSGATLTAPPSVSNAAALQHDNAARRTGFLYLLGVDVVWGLYPVLAADLVSRHDPYFVAGVSALTAGIPFAIYMAMTGRLSRVIGSQAGPGVRMRLVAVALSGTVMSSLFFFSGAARTSGLNASLLSQTEPVYSMVLAALFLKERISPQQLLATSLLLLGALGVMWKGGLEFQSGDVLVVLTPFWYQLGHLIAKKLYADIVHPYAIPAVRMTLGGSILLAIALIRRPELVSSLVDLSVMLPLTLFGVLVVATEKLFWYAALQRIPLAQASAMLVPSVGVGVLTSWLWLGQSPEGLQWLGFVLLLVGLVLLAREGLRSHP